MSTFIELCLSGDAFLDEIDDYVDKWHDGDGQNLELHEYLGLNDEEYSLWLTSPSQLANIIFAREHKIPLQQALNDEIYQLAARADKADQIERIKKWLAKKGN